MNLRGKSSRFRASLLNIDIFGQSLNWRVKGEEKHKSTIGVILTVMVTSIMLFFGIKAFVSMVDHDNPKVVQRLESLDLTVNERPPRF